jgi:hypothetical protein
VGRDRREGHPDDVDREIGELLGDRAGDATRHGDRHR